MFSASPPSLAPYRSEGLTASHTNLRDSQGLRACLTLLDLPFETWGRLTGFSGSGPLTALSRSYTGLCMPGQLRMAKQTLANQLLLRQICGGRALSAVFLFRESLSHEFAFSYI